MKIPEHAFIPQEKLTQYLLVRKPKNDKSQFLHQVGFTQYNPELLEAAIRHILANNEAVQDRTNMYGTLYQVIGELIGPRGSLQIVTVWILRTGDDTYRFVILKPVR